MANSANISAYADDAATQYILRPLSREAGVQEYIESNTTKSLNSLISMRLSELVQKNKMLRRQKQTVFPVMETAAAFGSGEGYVAPPKVAHEVIVQTTVIAHPRATASEIANALKIHESTVITDTGAAGTANAYRDVSNQVGEVLIRGFMPA